MKTFFPGNRSRVASKLPSPNSLMQAMAFFFTAMWPKTMSFTPWAMSWKAPWNFSAGILTSMSPASCSALICFISAMKPLILPRIFSMVSLMKTFFPGKVSRVASKLPSPNSLMQAMAFFFTAIWPKTIVFTPSAMVR